jgi:four helix bundle protein
MRDFRSLQVWEKAHRLTVDIYQATKSFPADERFGLTSQARRSAASIPTNIAEGCGREGEKELARFLTIAAGSASELEYQLLLARDLGFLDRELSDTLCAQVAEIRQMIAGLLRKLRSALAGGQSSPDC